MDNRGVKISQLAAWNKGINVGDKELFEIASEGQSYKISATTLVQSVITQIREELDKYALKEKTVGYPAEKRSLLPIWRVTDSSLYEVLYANNGFLKNTQLDGIINNTRSYFYSDDFEREHTGFSIWKSTGGWNVECDNLYVRKAIKAKEYVIESINALKGTQILSAANGEIKSVEETTYNGVEVYQIAFEGDLLSYRAGDIILHQTYGDPNQPLSQRRYIAVIQSVSEGNQFIRLNKSDFVDDTGAYIQDVPVVGDETVQYGHISDPDRQGLIQLSAAYNIDGSGSKPYISIITDINGRYGLDVSVDELVKGNIATAGKTRSIFGHLKDFPYRPTDTSIRPNSGFGIVTDNGLFSGRVMATEGNIMNLLTIGGSIDQYWGVTGGTAGIYGGTELSTPRYNDTAQPVRFFAGGDYSQAKSGTAPVVIKADGSGYLADGNISWDDVGNTKISAELTIVTPSGNKDLIDYIQGVSNELQNQIDKAVESWFYPFDPSIDRPPVTAWRAESASTGRPLATILRQHINDTFTNVWDGTPGPDPNTGIAKGGTIGASWRWTLKSGTTGDNLSDYQWTQLSDSALNDALNKLGKLQTQVDGIQGDVANKITTYVTSYPTHSKDGIAADQPPLNYKKGDLWYNTLTTSILVATADNLSYNFDDWQAVVDESLDYLKDALKQTTKITGGVVLTSILGVGAYQTADGTDVWSDMAGICGLLGNDPTAIRFYAGASLGSRRTVTDAELSTVNIPFFIRQDGAGRVGSLVFKDGVITSITTGNSLDIGNSKFQILGDRIIGTLATTNQPNIDKEIFTASVGSKDASGNYITGKLQLQSLIDQSFAGNWTQTGNCNLRGDGIVVNSYLNSTINHTYQYDAVATGLGTKTVKSYNAFTAIPATEESTLFVGASDTGKAITVYTNAGTGIEIVTNYSAKGITSQAPIEIYRNKYYSASIYTHQGYARVGTTGLDYQAPTMCSFANGSRIDQSQLSNVVFISTPTGGATVDLPYAPTDGPANQYNILCPFEVTFIGAKRTAADADTTTFKFYGWQNSSATSRDYLYYHVGIENQGAVATANGTISLAGADIMRILFCPGTKLTQDNGLQRPVAYILYVKTQ